MNLLNAGGQKWKSFSLQKATIHLSSDITGNTVSLFPLYSIISLPKEQCLPRERGRGKPNWSLQPSIRL